MEANKPETQPKAVEPAVKEIADDISKGAERPSVLPLIFVLILIAVVLRGIHSHISSPITPGVRMRPGTWRSRCGLLGFLPSCQNAFIQVNDDGTMNLFNDEPSLAMKLKGNACNGRKGCRDGVVLHDNGSVSIGGQLAKTIVSYKKDMDITPWPFTKKPKLHVRYYSTK